MDPLFTTAAALWSAVDTRTANLARHSLRSGELGELAEEVLGRTPAASELEALSEFLEDLRKEGL